MALAFAILGDILPPRERGRYVGYFTLAFVGAALLGPLVGGFIIEHFSWPWIFYINVPLAFGVGVVCHFALRLPFHRREAKLDYAGAALLSTAIARLHDRAWRRAPTGGRSATCSCCSWSPRSPPSLFIGVELRAPEPLIPPRLFRDRVVVGCVLLGLFAGVVTYGPAQFLPLYFQDSLFVSPTESGLADAAADDRGHGGDVRHRPPDRQDRPLQAVPDHRLDRVRHRAAGRRPDHRDRRRTRGWSCR